MMQKMPLLMVVFFLTLTVSSAFAKDQWPYYGGTQWGERHVKFSQIGKHNVAHMVPRRVLQLGKIAYSMTSSPLVIDGVLYVTSAAGVVRAFDLRTGVRKWSYKHETDPRIKGAVDPAAQALGFTSNCCSNTSRGVAYK